MALNLEYMPHKTDRLADISSGKLEFKTQPLSSFWAALEQITASFIYESSCAAELRRHAVSVTDSAEDGMKFQRQFFLRFIVCSNDGELP